MIARFLGPLVRRFLKEDSGVISVQNLFIFMAAGMVSAQAVDVTHLYTVREQLKVAADTAAHSALWTRNRGDAPADPTEAATAARTAAISAVRWGNPLRGNGHIVETRDITFGTWNASTRSFRVDNASRNAVMVTAARERDSGNVVPTFLYTLIGVGAMNVEAVSVFTTYRHNCADDGIMSQVKVDLRSGNDFYRGICLFGPIIQINSNNTFEAGTMVTMPNPDDWIRYNQASTFESNIGLRDALRPGFFDFYILERIKAAGNLRPGDVSLDVAVSSDGPERPSYIDQATVGSHLVWNTSDAGRSNNVTPSTFTQGRVHRVTCGNGNNDNKLTFGPGTYQNIVLLTNCILDMSGKVNLENAVLSTTSTDADSVRTSSGNSDGLVIGKDDNCAAGGGAQILTRGGFKSAAKLEIYGSQILALGEVSFTAGGSTVNEFEGVSIIAQGTVSGTSGNDFTGCPANRNNIFETTYFRPAW